MLRIHLRDYYHGDLAKLEFPKNVTGESWDLAEEVEEIATVHGYGCIKDTDEYGDDILILVEENVDNTDAEHIQDLKSLVVELTNNFIL